MKVSTTALNIQQFMDDDNNNETEEGQQTSAERTSVFALGLGEQDYVSNKVAILTSHKARRLSVELTRRHERFLREQRLRRRQQLVRQNTVEQQEEEEGQQQQTSPVGEEQQLEEACGEQQLPFSSPSSALVEADHQQSVGPSSSNEIETARITSNHERLSKPKWQQRQQQQLANQQPTTSTAAAVPPTATDADGAETARKRRVVFTNVEVFQFGWTQGRNTIPSSGLTTLGMEDTHHARHTFKLDEHAKYKQAEKRKKLQSWKEATRSSEASNCSTAAERSSRRRRAAILAKKREKIERRKGKGKGRSSKRKMKDRALEQSRSSSEEDGEAGEGEYSSSEIEEDVVYSSEEEEELELEDEEEEGGEFFEEFHVFEPMRRMILQNCGVPIEEEVEDDTLRVVGDRAESKCGCKCVGQRCLPASCECALEGIQCQVDFFDAQNPSNSFPCACSAKLCGNPEGRVEMDQMRIRNHFLQTMMRLKAAKKKGLDENGEMHSPQHIFFRDGGEDVPTTSHHPQKPKMASVVSTQLRPQIAQISCQNKQRPTPSLPPDPFVTTRKRKIVNKDVNGTDATITLDAQQATEGKPEEPVPPLPFPKSPSLLSSSHPPRNDAPIKRKKQ